MVRDIFIIKDKSVEKATKKRVQSRKKLVKCAYCEGKGKMPDPLLKFTGTDICPVCKGRGKV